MKKKQVTSQQVKQIRYFGLNSETYFLIKIILSITEKNVLVQIQTTDMIFKIIL